MADTRKPTTILIVEDDALIASYLSGLVAELGFIAAGTAASGAEALAVAGAVRADLALIDIGLLGPIDGIDLAVRLKREYAVPAIFISGLIDPATAQRARTAQPLGLVQKPFRPSELFNAIERALAVMQGSARPV
jgi:CheY-like chemotaxis protein